MNTIQKLGLAVASVGIALGGAFGVTQLANTSANAAQTQSQSGMAAPGANGGQAAGQPGAGAQTGAPTELAAQLASTLNVDQTKVATALNTAFTDATGQNLQPGSDAFDTAIAKSLATSLGVDQATVQQVLTTFQASMDAGGGPQGQAPAASGNTGTSATGTTTQA